MHSALPESNKLGILVVGYFLKKQQKTGELEKNEELLKLLSKLPFGGGLGVWYVINKNAKNHLLGVNGKFTSISLNVLVSGM